MTYMDDLISRAWLKEAIHNFFNGLAHEVTEEDIQRYIEVAPSVFNGMTNGEVMQAVYSDSEICIDETWKTVTVYLGVHEDYCEDEVRFDLDWWNAPYKGVRE
jgi:hypothetical protein